MQPTAIVVNVARGPVVDTAALTEALWARRIFAAALDVTELKMDQAGKVVFKVRFLNGSISDPAGKEGLTYATASLMASGGAGGKSYADAHDSVGTDARALDEPGQGPTVMLRGFRNGAGAGSNAAARVSNVSYCVSVGCGRV